MHETITIPSRVECIDDARRWVGARAAAHVGADVVSEIELVLTEALANVIEHGYGGDDSKEIAIGAELVGGAFCVVVRDWGAIADPATFQQRDLDDPGEGGYGLFLIEELMDEVRREPQPDGGTLLTLIKMVQPQDN